MENTVYYKVYFNNHILPDDSGTENLEEYLAEIVAYLSPITGDYIWQNQPFALQVDSEVTG